MVVLARSAGCVVVRDGDRVILADKGTQGLAIGIYVSGLLAFVLGVNGLLQVVMSVVGPMRFPVLGVVFLGIAAVPASILVLLVRVFRRRRDAPIHPEHIRCVVDQDRGIVLASDGSTLGAIDECRLARTFQLTSSSRALVLDTPRCRILLAAANPFSGSVKPLAEALAAVGVSLK